MYELMNVSIKQHSKANNTVILIRDLKHKNACINYILTKKT